MSTATMTPPVPDMSGDFLRLAAARLARTDAGRDAARLLHGLLRTTASALDDTDQRGLIGLLTLGYHPRTAAVLTLLEQTAAGASVVIAGEDGL